MKPWIRLEIDEPMKVGWRWLTRKVFLAPDGQEGEFYTFGKPGDRNGAVIALTPENQVIIAEQFRPGPEVVMQELPGGMIDVGEDSQIGVMRELEEETGYHSKKVTFIGKVQKSAYSNATTYFYMARNCQKTSNQHLDNGEHVMTRLISIDDLIANAKTGLMTDPQAVLMAYEDLKSILEEK